jgi:predicted nucleotide-binding protein
MSKRIVTPTRPPNAERKKRNFPKHMLEEALVVAQKITDEAAGKPFKRLLLADALGIKPASSNFAYLLSSSIRYQLTEGSEKASEITLTASGVSATQTVDAQRRLAALRTAAFAPEVFSKFYRNFVDHKIPTSEMLKKLLVSDYGVATDVVDECANILLGNGRFVGIIRDIGGSPHVLLDGEPPTSIQPTDQATETVAEPESRNGKIAQNGKAIDEIKHETPLKTAEESKPIFIGHGKNTKPLQKLEAILSSFQIPHKVTTGEANPGRPIPQKVKETMVHCGSAILIFTCDEKFQDEDGNVIWRPSENVVHELGAASFAYGDRIVIFKEKGLHFPTNFQSIGYIEFEVDSIEAKATDLLKELIGFGLVKITPA